VADEHACYFCQSRIVKDPDDHLCSGCGIYICEGDEYACASRISPFMRPNHRPEDHVVPCGTCGEAECGCQCRECDEEGCTDEGHRLKDLGIYELPAPPRVPTVAEIEAAIGIKAKDWNGRCYEIATKLHDSGLVKGQVRYGLYWGRISRNSEKFAGRTITHHGWIERPDRTVVDPTRWAFEGARPYVWSGWGGKVYDVGGSALYENDPLPTQVKDSDQEIDLGLDRETRAFVSRLLKDPPKMIKEHAVWLAHRSPDSLGRWAKPIYQALVDRGLGAYLQHDMRVAVLGKSR